MGNKQSKPQPQPPVQPSVFTPEAGLVAIKPNADLPIFNLRNINPGRKVGEKWEEKPDDPKFWIDIAKRYPYEERRKQREWKEGRESLDNEIELGAQVLIKLRSYKNFMYIINDLVRWGEGGGEEYNTAAEHLKRIKDKDGSYANSTMTMGVSQIFQYEHFNRENIDELTINYVNSITGEGLEPGKIDSYLSPYGNAMVIMRGHVTVIRKINDNYFFIDPLGNKYRTAETQSSQEGIPEILSKALPPGKHIEESMCIFQSNRGVCMLYSMLFMCYPDLSPVQLQEIIGETFQRTYTFLKEWHAKNPYSIEYMNDSEENFYKESSGIPLAERNDLYILAVMEDFLFTDQGPIRRLPPEQRLAKRKTAGRRKIKRRRKTRRKHLLK